MPIPVGCPHPQGIVASSLFAGCATAFGIPERKPRSVWQAGGTLEFQRRGRGLWTSIIIPYVSVPEDLVKKSQAETFSLGRAAPLLHRLWTADSIANRGGGGANTIENKHLHEFLSRLAVKSNQVAL